MSDHGKKILLTGGSGFIGKNIFEQLGSSHTIIAPTHRQCDLLDADSVQRFVKQHDFDVVIHAAGSGVAPQQQQITGIGLDNIRMFFNLDRALKTSQRMIFLGSGAEYDKQRDIAGIREEQFDQVVPADEYGFAKYVCSKYIERSENIVNLRCFGVYGKYEKSGRFISQAILSVLNDKPITIRQNVFFDYTFIDDLVKIVDFFASHKPRHKFYNAASGTRVDLLTLAREVEKASGSKHGIVIEQDGLSKEYTADNRRLLKEMPELKFTSHAEGIRQLLGYYKSNFHV